MIKEGEIVHANLTFKISKNRIVVAKEIVFARPYKGKFQTIYKMDVRDDYFLLKKCGIKEEAELIKVDVIKSLGFSVKYAGHSVVKKSETDMKRQKDGNYN